MELRSTKDEMISELLKDVRLNRYDLAFLTNIKQKYLDRNHPLSEKQSDLVDKIIKKYRKQLKKLDIDYKKILSLPWKNGIITSDELRKKTFFRFSNDGNMELYFNFNKKMIEEIRGIVHDDVHEYFKTGMSSQFGGDRYDFNWHSEEKMWRGPFNVYCFRNLFYFANKHGIQIDPAVKNLHSVASQTFGDKKSWTPHCRIINNRIYINMITESMLSYLDDIDMTDLSFKTFERIAELGIDLPDDFLGIAKKFISYKNNIYIDKSELDEFHNFVTKCNYRVIVYNRSNLKIIDEYGYDQMIISNDEDIFKYIGKYDILLELSFSNSFNIDNRLKVIEQDVKKIVKIKIDPQYDNCVGKIQN